MTKGRIDPEDKKWEAVIDDLVREMQTYAKARLASFRTDTQDKATLAIVQAMIYAASTITLSLSSNSKATKEVLMDFLNGFFESWDQEQSKEKCQQ